MHWIKALPPHSFPFHPDFIYPSKSIKNGKAQDVKSNQLFLIKLKRGFLPLMPQLSENLNGGEGGEVGGGEGDAQQQTNGFISGSKSNPRTLIWYRVPCTKKFT